MADNDNLGDEYQFADTDAMDNNEESSLSDSHFSDPKTLPDNSEKNNIKRIFLIFVPMMIVAIVLFKIFNAYFGEKQPEKVVPTVPIVAAPRQPEAIAPPIAQSVTQPDSKLNDRISALDETQHATRTDMATMNDQLNMLGKNVNDMVAKIAELNVIIKNLSMKVDEQAHRVDVITMRLAPKKVPHQNRHTNQRVIYHLEAVIPGRAWLMGSDGNTLTVRKGSMLPGYGIVTFIDANQGRVSINSGQVIRFSQDDN
jgi:intracellular multiplication protein IcmG